MVLSMLRRSISSWLQSERRPHRRPETRTFRPRLEGLERREVPATVAPLWQPSAAAASAQIAGAQVRQAQASVANRHFESYKESLSHLWQIVALTRNACQAPWLSLQFGQGDDAIALANFHKIRRLGAGELIFEDCMQARDRIQQAVIKYERGLEIGGDEQQRLNAEADQLMQEARDLAYPAVERWYAMWYLLHSKGWKALARYDVEFLRSEVGQWPNLRRYSILSPGTGWPPYDLRNNELMSTPGYFNCFAWSVGKTNTYFFPDNYASMHRFFLGNGFRGYPSTHAPLRNPRLFANVAVYGFMDPNTGRMVYTHAARQMPNGTWTSKLGQMGLIGHARASDVAGGGYGGIVAYYWKPR